MNETLIFDITDKLRRRRRMMLALAAFIAVLSATGAVLFSDAGRHSRREARALSRSYFGFAIAAGIAWLFRRPAEHHPVIVALRDTPQRIVWIYRQEEGQGAAKLRLCLEDGTRLGVDLDLGDGDALMSAVAACAPAATVGYSADADTLYRRFPAALRRSIG